MDPNRKTDIPVKAIPQMIEDLLKMCMLEELLFMSRLASSQRDFKLFTSILTKLTDTNIHDVFYARGIEHPEQLMHVWIGKRAEVAGLKAFQMACQAASAEIDRRKKILAKQKRKKEEEDV